MCCGPVDLMDARISLIQPNHRYRIVPRDQRPSFSPDRQTFFFLLFSRLNRLVVWLLVGQKIDMSQKRRRRSSCIYCVQLNISYLFIFFFLFPKPQKKLHATLFTLHLFFEGFFFFLILYFSSSSSVASFSLLHSHGYIFLGGIFFFFLVVGGRVYEGRQID